MAERIQLKEPGAHIDLLVSSVKPEVVERNDYYLFGNGSKELLVPQSSVKAQLERMGVSSAEQMIGKWVRFGRSTKMSRANKPYWDIDWASGAEAPSQSAGGETSKPTTGTSASAPSADPAIEKPKQRVAYKALTEWVLKEIIPLYDAAGLQPSGVIAAACVQTLFIQACNAGKVE